MTTRDDLTPLDRRPEDVDTSFFRLVPRQPANLSAFFNQALRRAAGRGLAPTAPVPTPPTLPVPTASRLDDAVARIEAGDVRAGIALALAADEPDAESVQVAYNTLRNQVQADGYKTIASILSLSPDPTAPLRALTALVLLTLDGPGDAHTAGVLMTATGDDLTAIVNGLRLRAGLPSWLPMSESRVYSKPKLVVQVTWLSNSCISAMSRAQSDPH